VEAERELLAMLDTIDGGTPYAAMLGDLAETIETLREWPRLARWHGGVPFPSPAVACTTRPTDHLGVGGKVVPFKARRSCHNQDLAARSPAYDRPQASGSDPLLSALAFGEICRRVLPEGVVNIAPAHRDRRRPRSSPNGQATVVHGRDQRRYEEPATRSGGWDQDSHPRTRRQEPDDRLSDTDPDVALPAPLTE
jgi:hypothetical protein